MPLLIVLIAPILLSLTNVGDKCISNKQKEYTIYYTSKDTLNITEYKVYFEKGTRTVTDFFQSFYKKDFDIFIHPTRASLDSSWQNDWNMPDFKSQCWMVASGVADKLDIISPKMWDNIACEHVYPDTVKTLNLITHELVHVFHGQQNKSPDFSEVVGIDWFVEGLATYASGQCDPVIILEVKKSLLDNKIPESLDKFWTGNLRYGLSGTAAIYLDNKYGREKLIDLLKYNNIKEVLNSLETTESEILNGWEKYMQEL
ncbi:MAG: hypothetical protein ABJK11_08385 [Balneola sp.]